MNEGATVVSPSNRVTREDRYPRRLWYVVENVLGLWNMKIVPGNVNRNLVILSSTSDSFKIPADALCVESWKVRMGILCPTRSDSGVQIQLCTSIVAKGCSRSVLARISEGV